MAKAESEQMVSLTFEQVKELLASATASGASQETVALINALTTSTKGLQDQVKRTVRVSNAEHENESIFNFKAGCQFCDARERHPEDPNIVGSGKVGHPKPALKFESYFPEQARVFADDATVLEVELFNALGTKLSANPMQPISIRKGTWEARLSPDARRLFVKAPSFTSDERNSLPSLPLILIELLEGGAKSDPMDAVNASIAKRLEQLESVSA
jgi:hypothetical protein